MFSFFGRDCSPMFKILNMMKMLAELLKPFKTLKRFSCCCHLLTPALCVQHTGISPALYNGRMFLYWGSFRHNSERRAGFPSCSGEGSYVHTQNTRGGNWNVMLIHHLNLWRKSFSNIKIITRKLNKKYILFVLIKTFRVICICYFTPHIYF